MKGDLTIVIDVRAETAIQAITTQTHQRPDIVIPMDIHLDNIAMEDCRVVVLAEEGVIHIVIGRTTIAMTIDERNSDVLGVGVLIANAVRDCRTGSGICIGGEEMTRSMSGEQRKQKILKRIPADSNQLLCPAYRKHRAGMRAKT